MIPLLALSLLAALPVGIAIGLRHGILIGLAAASATACYAALCGAAGLYVGRKDP